MTHDQEEAFEVADQIVVMNNGKIEQEGSPAQVFEHPANAFVMDFLGNVNIFPVSVQDGRAPERPGPAPVRCAWPATPWWPPTSGRDLRVR